MRSTNLLYDQGLQWAHSLLYQLSLRSLFERRCVAFQKLLCKNKNQILSRLK